MKKSLALLVPAALAAACSTSVGAGPSAATQEGPQTSQQKRFPGANGEIAAIDGATLQVQSATDQTAVTWSTKTVFTDTVRTTAAAVVVGSCVAVRDANAVPRASAAPGPSATAPTTVTAVSVSISAPVDGGCTGRPDRGGPPTGALGTPPSGVTPPSGARAPVGAFGGGAFGKVTATSAGGFVVTSERPGASGSTTVTTTVRTTSTTTYTTERTATAAALKVGECVSARGTTDSTGTLAATSITIRPKTDGSCDAPFGARRG